MAPAAEREGTAGGPITATVADVLTLLVPYSLSQRRHPGKPSHPALSPGGQPALRNPLWAEAETFRETSSRAEHGQEINQHLISWLKDQPRQKACQFLQSQGVAAGPVNTAQDA